MGLTRIRAQQISNIDYKQAVRVVTTTNIANLAGGAPNSVDSVSLNAGDRILVAGQNTGSQNGLYYVATLGTGSNGTWSRTSDANETGEIEAGMVVMVTEGAIYADKPWKLITNDPIIIGTTSLVFQQFATGPSAGGSNNEVQFNYSGNLAGSPSLTWTGSEFYVDGTANVTGNVTGSYFIGNGSQLTGISTSTDRIFSGQSNVDISTANANVTVSVNGTSNVAVFTPNGLSVTGNVTGNGIAITTVSNTAPVNPEQGDIWIDSDTGIQYIYFTSGGNSQWAEMEAYQTFGSGSGSTYGNANVLAYLTTGVAGNILPSANVTYDLGSTANRWNDIWLANSTIYLGEATISATDGAVALPANSTVGGAVVTAVPKITGFTYPGDDTAANPAGGQTILVNGANFESGSTIYLDNAVVSPVVFVNSTQLSFTSPAKATGTYSVYVVNPDGSTALALPGIIYSGVPAWSTASGNIGTPYETNLFSTLLVATADSAITYAAAPGNTLPANLSLNASTGNLSGTIPVTNNDTTYTFSVRATDAELQDTDRQFSVTYKTDVVTWASPANASSYTWDVGVANSVAMSASSAAGKAVSFAVQSGSLPANVAITGNTIAGTPTAAQANTAVVVRATAATTNRFADQTFYFTTQVAGWDISAPVLAQNITSGVNIDSFGSISFSTDGTKLFTVSAPTIYTYNLGGAYDLSSISQVRTYAATGFTTSVVFSADGTKMYTTDYSADTVKQHNLTTAYDTDSITTTSTFSVAGQQGLPFQVVFSSDGTKMFVSGNGPRAVTRYDLATPWTVTTASFVSTFSVPDVSPGGNMRKVFFKTDGTAMFVTCENSDQSQGQVRKYTLGAAWDLASPTLTTTFATWPSGSIQFFPGKCGLWFNSTGTIMVLGSNDTQLLRKYTL